jgi:hypothetical protein
LLIRKYPSPLKRRNCLWGINTDSLGKFTIHFIAQPEKNTRKAAKPVFTYRVEATVTDDAGEAE